MELSVNGIEVDCVIGERPDERVRLQRLVVDVRLETSGPADRTDELADTVDYVALAAKIRETLVSAQCKMIERAARLAADACMTFPGVTCAEARITKAGAVPGLRSASVTCRTGDKTKESSICPTRKPWWRF